jgi:hypothetical protein
MPLLVASAGCATQTVAVSDVRSFKPLTWSCKDTAQTRAGVVAHNSVLESLKSGKRIVYKDDCPQEAKPTS